MMLGLIAAKIRIINAFLALNKAKRNPYYEKG
jgi:hypothetical protein